MLEEQVAQLTKQFNGLSSVIINLDSSRDHERSSNQATRSKSRSRGRYRKLKELANKQSFYHSNCAPPKKKATVPSAMQKFKSAIAPRQ